MSGGSIAPVLIVWCGEAHAAPPGANVVLWSGVSSSNGARALVDLVEADADEVRRRYLAWVHGLGEIRIGVRRLRACFTLPDGSDLWAQSAFVEQSPWKQRSLEPILKLIALERLLEREQPSQVHFYSADTGLAAVVRAICRERDIRYEGNKLPKRARFTLSDLRRALPAPLLGLGLFAWLVATRAILRRPQPAKDDTRRPGVLICGPFFNFDAARCAEGSFASSFWTTLPSLLVREGRHITWLHCFYPHEACRTVSRADSMIRQLANSPEHARGTHLLLDAYFTIAAASKVLVHWIRIGLASVPIERRLARELAHQPALGYGPLLRADWARAFRGAQCVENLYLAECFHRALASVPAQQEGLYLLENQGWERALAAAWKRNSHGRLTGVAHSTIRFWDLRYHRDPRHYDAGGLEPHPGPDVVALNGPTARRAYLSSTRRRERLTECEALRYLHLARGSVSGPSSVDRGRRLKVLVLGDYFKADTEQVMLLLEAARARLGQAPQIVVKPHPNCPIAAEDFPELDFSLTDAVVGHAAADTDIVVAGNATSAAIDAYASGARVVIHHGAGLNYSPLRGRPDVLFVRTAEQLCEAVSKLHGYEHAPDGRLEDLFHLDDDLPRWRNYLGIAQPLAQTAACARTGTAT